MGWVAYLLGPIAIVGEKYQPFTLLIKTTDMKESIRAIYKVIPNAASSSII
jgi:hypothetical protein